MIYHTFAQLYDQLFDDQLYEDWAQYTLEHGGERATTILDLAGGAGRLAVLLAKAGKELTVVDLSADMLALAAQHATDAGVELNLLQADMRDLAGLPGYDMVTCYADSFSYLDNLADVTTSFRQVHDHLKAGGHFLFDVITPYQTDVVYPGYMYNYEDDDHQHAFMWRSYGNDEVEHGVIHDLAFFNRLDDGQYERVGETHFERSYPLADLQQALVAAGFNRVRVSADFGRTAPNEETTRWFFDCQK